MAGTGRHGLKRRILDLAPKLDARRALSVAFALLLAGSAAVPAVAQSSWWPFGGNDEPARPRAPVPSESVYGDPYADPNTQPPPGARRPNSICLELEQRLVQDGQRGGESRNLIPMVENELRQAEQAHRSQRQQLDRSDCYEYFLFSKTLRRTRRCVDLANQADSTRRRIDDLEVQLSQLQGSSGRSYRDEIIRELARNDCGASYQQQARRQSGGGLSGFWDDGESSGYSGGGSSFGALPYATYRTVCVRLCDGYYFPVSFSTLPNHFQRDEEVCASKCAAPAALYYHQNPGAGMEQAVAARDNTPYKQLKTAFKYRKEYINGCSCKMAEYQPASGAVVNQGVGQGGGWTAQTPTGSTHEQRVQPPPAEPPQQYDNGGGSEELPWATSP
ncbi:DUF2865 domain-containing protein [Hyphomicrobium sp. CS1GBMeth3]|uniref:DUF2865 domain-containing protein n=1 Tax=Hyphomicrobium sp. CS1GBMeth3 TaxID=1892845 RepID=UPI00093091B5|nr:DUF2865 domain-containing protein [Hyphomicrobium sp. CS1GBMeth3]